MPMPASRMRVATSGSFMWESHTAALMPCPVPGIVPMPALASTVTVAGAAEAGTAAGAGWAASAAFARGDVVMRAPTASTTAVQVTGRRSRRRSEEHTSELQSLAYLVCRLLLEKKKNNKYYSLFNKKKKKKNIKY